MPTWNRYPLKRRVLLGAMVSDGDIEVEQVEKETGLVLVKNFLRSQILYSWPGLWIPIRPGGRLTNHSIWEVRPPEIGWNLRWTPVVASRYLFQTRVFHIHLKCFSLWEFQEVYFTSKQLQPLTRTLKPKRSQHLLQSNFVIGNAALKSSQLWLRVWFLSRSFWILYQFSLHPVLLCGLPGQFFNSVGMVPGYCSYGESVSINLILSTALSCQAALHLLPLSQFALEQQCKTIPLRLTTGICGWSSHFILSMECCSMWRGWTTSRFSECNIYGEKRSKVNMYETHSFPKGLCFILELLIFFWWMAWPVLLQRSMEYIGMYCISKCVSMLRS